MNPLVVAAAACLGLFLLIRRKRSEDSSPPDVLLDPTGAGSDAGVSFRSTAEAAMAETGAQSKFLGAGAAAGSVLGPAGALVGGSVGLIIARLLADAPDIMNWPWSEWAMPYWPGATRIETGDDGVERLCVPVVAEDGVSPAEMRVSTDLLRSLFPGNGAFESCLLSGMFCWRPREVATPFSVLLYEVCPHLLGYEARFLTRYRLPPSVVDEDPDPGDRSLDPSRREEAARIWWWLFMLGTSDLDASPMKFKRSLHIMRRAFAYCALLDPSELPREAWAWSDYFGGSNPSIDLGFASVEFQDPFNPGAGGPFQTSAMVFAKYADKLRRDFNVEPLHRSTPLPDVTAVFLQYRRNALCGFPGAWCYTSDPATITAITPKPASGATALMAQALPGVVRQAAPVSGAFGTVYRQRSERAPSGSVTSDTRIRVWMPSFDSTAGGFDLGLVDDPAAPIWGRSHVVPLGLFVASGEYSSESEVVDELESGGLAWGPASTPRALRAWAVIVPGSDTEWADAKRRRVEVVRPAFGYMAANPDAPDGSGFDLLDEAHYQQRLEWAADEAAQEAASEELASAVASSSAPAAGVDVLRALRVV